LQKKKLTQGIDERGVMNKHQKGTEETSQKAAALLSEKRRERTIAKKKKQKIAITIFSEKKGRELEDMGGGEVSFSSSEDRLPPAASRS